MRRLVVVMHFDGDGLVAPHVRRAIEAMRVVASRLVIVSSSPLTPDAADWLSTRGELIRVPDEGFDFCGHQAALSRTSLDDVELVLMNGMVVPLVDAASIFEQMDARPQVDFWV